MRSPVEGLLLPVLDDLNELSADYFGAEFEHLKIVELQPLRLAVVDQLPDDDLESQVYLFLNAPCHVACVVEQAIFTPFYLDVSALFE